MIKPRHITNKLLTMGRHFPVVALTGARQVGKSTLLRALLPDAQYVVFDPMTDVRGVRDDPDLFLDQLRTPVILDEIQYVPELLGAIKRRVDEARKPGQYWLTACQHWSALRGMKESLAGRVAVLNLQPMTFQERHGHSGPWLADFLSDAEGFLHARMGQVFEGPSSVACLWQGGYPGLIGLDEALREQALRAYVLTYIERDVRLLHSPPDLRDFTAFVRLLVHRTAQEIHHAQLGRELGISAQTAKHWVQLLNQTFLWAELPPYRNLIKRLSKKPKGLWIDAALACHLMHLSSSESLLGHPALGVLFETYVIQDLLRQFPSLNHEPGASHWRAHSGAEVDLVLEADGIVYPIEIKHKRHPNKQDTRGIVAMRQAYPERRWGPGLVISPCPEVYALGNDCVALPFAVF